MLYIMLLSSKNIMIIIACVDALVDVLVLVSEGVSHTRSIHSSDKLGKTSALGIHTGPILAVIVY